MLVGKVLLVKDDEEAKGLFDNWRLNYQKDLQIWYMAISRWITDLIG